MAEVTLGLSLQENNITRFIVAIFKHTNKSFDVDSWGRRLQTHRPLCT